MNKVCGFFIFLGCIGLCWTTVQAESFTNEIPGYIWDISGDYEEDLDGVSLEYSVVQDGKGKLSGFGSADGIMVEDGVTIGIHMDFSVMGKVKGKDEVTYLKQKLLARGTATAYGQTINFKASVSMVAEIDNIEQAMSGTVTVKMMGFKETESYYEDLSSEDMDGSAVLFTELWEENGKLVGDAVIELSNGRQIRCAVKAKELVSALKIQAKGLRDDLDSKGSKLTILYAGEDLIFLKGKVSGQKVEYN